MPHTPLFVGINVAKAQLDIAVRPIGEQSAIPNTALYWWYERRLRVYDKAAGNDPR